MTVVRLTKSQRSLDFHFFDTISLMLSSNFMELFRNKCTIATFNTTDIYLDNFSSSDIFEFSNFSNYILQTINASFRAHSYKTAQDYI